MLDRRHVFIVAATVAMAACSAPHPPNVPFVPTSVKNHSCTPSPKVICGIWTAFPIAERHTDEIVVGPSGRNRGLWYSVGGVESGVVQFIPPSSATPYRVHPGANVHAVAVAPDKSIWFLEQSSSKIGAIDAAGNLEEIDLPDGARVPISLVWGPDKAFWFTLANPGKIGRITIRGKVTQFPIPGKGVPRGIAVGADHALWFVEPDTKQIGRITTSGEVTQFPAAVGASNLTKPIALGPDGRIWYGASDRVASISTDGAVRSFDLPKGSTKTGGIFSASQGDVFVGVYDGATQQGSVVSISRNGHMHEYDLPEKRALPEGLTQTADGALWMAVYDMDPNRKTFKLFELQ